MATVLVKVRPHNNYGGHAPAGTLLEVEEAELARVPWCFDRVGDALPDSSPFQPPEEFAMHFDEAGEQSKAPAIAPAPAPESPKAAPPTLAKPGKRK